MTVRVGMLSWDHIHAEFRARALGEIPDAEIVVIADDNAVRGQAAADRFGVSEVTTDWRDLVARDDLDVVMIHSSNEQHAEQAIALAEGGTDIFVEKPLTTNAVDARRMVAAVSESGVEATTAFVSRFSQEAERAKRLIDEGWVGEIVSMSAVIGLAGIGEIGCPPDMVEWMENGARNGGGAWIDEGSHAVDLLRWFAGGISRVALFSRRAVKTHLEVEDIAVGTLEFKSGALATLTTSWSLEIDLGMRSAIEVYGTQGTLFVDPTSAQPGVHLFSRNLPDGVRGWAAPHIEPSEAEPHDFSSWPKHVHHYKREVASYIDRRVKGLTPYGPTLEDGLAAVAVIDAGYQSLREGTVINIDSISDQQTNQGEEEA